MDGSTGIDVKGAVNVPIVPGLVGLRISGATLNRDGYAKRLIDGDTQGDRSAQMIRAKLRIQPEGSGLTIDIGADYTRARETSAPSDLLAVGNAPGITGIPFLSNYNTYIAPGLGIVAPNGAKTLNPSFITASPFETHAGGPNHNDLDLWGVQGTVAYEIGGATLKSITAYRDMKAYFHARRRQHALRVPSDHQPRQAVAVQPGTAADWQGARWTPELCAGRLLFQGEGVGHRDRRPRDRAAGAGRPAAIHAGGVHPQLHQQPQPGGLWPDRFRDRPAAEPDRRGPLHQRQEGIHVDQRAPARPRCNSST